MSGRPVSLPGMQGTHLCQGWFRQVLQTAFKSNIIFPPNNTHWYFVLTQSQPYIRYNHMDYGLQKSNLIFPSLIFLLSLSTDPETAVCARDLENRVCRCTSSRLCYAFSTTVDKNNAYYGTFIVIQRKQRHVCRPFGKGMVICVLKDCFAISYNVTYIYSFLKVTQASV